MRRLPLLDQYLREQQDLSAVERFSRVADQVVDRVYRDLLPSSGQQYAFEVDLDACTGCKACVTACHNLNGLDDGETWRAVGLVHGGSAAQPVKQTITTACHHCVDPACMNGCPVGAYEKDAVTGIVKHLDDQCIGCQYCTLTCPYDVPQFNARLGIVRKCDMCSDRLADGLAPACVQACPNGAIDITVIDKQKAVEDAQAGVFVPGAPSPEITVPTTVYKTEHNVPRNVLPADFYTVKPSSRHFPLVVMLVLTQASVGAFAFGANPMVAAITGVLGLAASVLHLGRPLYAFRALLGLPTSWMSREILAFGIFAPLAAGYALLKTSALQALVIGSGALGILCSVFIYHATRRAFWSAPRTAFKFAGTAAILGLALAQSNPKWLVIACAAKLVMEAGFFHHLRDKRYTELKRSAILMRRDLVRYTAARFVLLLVGGILLPLYGGAAIPSIVLLFAAEILERTLFFAASSSPGMPGGT
jgi:Fe-S-cluster-containing dehydrogenase component/DMSO reductase anchor subunit